MGGSRRRHGLRSTRQLSYRWRCQHHRLDGSRGYFRLVHWVTRSSLSNPGWIWEMDNVAPGRAHDMQRGPKLRLYTSFLLVRTVLAAFLAPFLPMMLPRQQLTYTHIHTHTTHAHKKKTYTARSLDVRIGQQVPPVVISPGNGISLPTKKINGKRSKKKKKRKTPKKKKKKKKKK